MKPSDDPGQCEAPRLRLCDSSSYSSIPIRIARPSLKKNKKTRLLLLISWTRLATMATFYVAQALEDRSDGADAGRVSRRLCDRTLYAIG